MLTEIYDTNLVYNEYGIIPAREKVTYALGVDLGRQRDYTAISLVEKKVKPVPLDTANSVDPVSLRQRVFPPKYTVKMLERRPLGEDYIEQARRVAQMVMNPQIAGNVEL